MSYFSSITMTLEITIFTIANANYCLLWVFKPVFNSEILKNDLIFDQWILNGLNLVNVVVWFRSRSSYLLHLVILLIFCSLICSELSVCLRVVHILCQQIFENFYPLPPPLSVLVSYRSPPCADVRFSSTPTALTHMLKKIKKYSV